MNDELWAKVARDRLPSMLVQVKTTLEMLRKSTLNKDDRERACEALGRCEGTITALMIFSERKV